MGVTSFYQNGFTPLPPTTSPLPPIAPLPSALRPLLRCLAALFEEQGVDSPRLSAELLVAEALGMERRDLLKRLVLEPDFALPPEALDRAGEYAARRAAGEPAAYILGRREFYGRDFLVTPATLIPRPETELLVETAAKAANGMFSGAGARRSQAAEARFPAGRPVFADFGTGSGCIAVTLALLLPGWRGLALDISPAALDVARQNANRHGAALDFLLADFTRPPLAPGSLALIAANPPYVSAAEYAELSPEVRRFEPETALVSGPALPLGNTGANSPAERGAFVAPGKSPSVLAPVVCHDGLAHAFAVIGQAERLLIPGGWLVMEAGCAHGPALLARASGPTWVETRILRDLAGLDRILAARRA